MKNFACLLLISLNSILCNAQSAYRWPEDTMKAKTEWVLLKDAMQQSRYLDAKAPLEWLIKEAPDLHLSLYVYGEKLYKTLIKEQEETQEHQQALLKLFEKRLSYYKDSANVLNRKLLAYYQFYKNDADSLKNMYLEFKDYFQKYPGQMLGANIIAYMDILRLIKKSGAGISDDEVFQTYDQLSLALQGMKESDDQKAKKQALLDKLLTSSVQLSCEIINSKFGQPFLAQYADDLDRAKKIIALGLAYGCKHSDAFQLPLNYGKHTNLAIPWLK